MQKTPSEGLHPSKKKKREREKKRKKKRKIIVIKRILQIQNVSLVAKWNVFAGNVLLNRDEKPRQLTPGRRQWHPTPVLFAWKIPWIEEPGRLQSMGSLGVRHD